MKLLEKIANVAVIVGVAVFLLTVVHDNFGKNNQRPPSHPFSLIGHFIKAPGLNLSPQRDTLLIAISVTCHFCQQSMPFYKELTSKSKSKVDIVAILPQTPKEAEAFLGNSGVAVDKVISMDLAQIGVVGTPTLLLIDSKGKVQQEWLGELSSKQKEQVMAHVL